ncbi:hypothetical protein QN277_006598 [Acacia crassicarpa]|uniref:J domain-containing protein n=1 Tax=Acacia crassicarpa TaxID=499986 RepID=A0AAE1ISR0_9FABA|nr:hypothetical protein QN277_006598 [Acacia crassicarpa]
MECKEEDAKKAKELAEKKILEMDAIGAKMLALKAQDLCPNLGGLPQLLATIEVYVSAEKRINGEVDWHRVLGVDPMADDETIRSCYKKQALTLHPDKNKSIGADGAFSLISQAWNLLSNKAKKIFYDKKCKHGFDSAKWKDRDPRSSAHPNPPHIPPVTPKHTFWTMCPSCRVYLEYALAYVNWSLVCPSCNTRYIGLEVPNPSIHRNTPSTSKGRMKKTPAKHSSKRQYRSGSNDIRVSSENLKRGHEDKAPPVMMEEPRFGKNQAVKTTDADSTFQSSCFGYDSVPKRDKAKKKRHLDKCREDNDRKEMSVPDPDFHDFDNGRTEKAFGENQVWAVYDDDDGMPRYYVLIHDVISLKPFKMKISWLNSKSNDELAPIKWIGSGFPKTSGDFRIGKHELNGSVNSFSHRVKWERGLRGVINIYPKKGDVWALYRNWSPDWNELTPDEIIHKYDMVEVLDDYNEEQGVDVALLVKVAGFKAVFRRHVDPRNIWNIPRAEMFRLSHQVPSYLLTGRESVNAPRGCLELDPAALPMELLQVLTEEQELGTGMKIEKSSEDTMEPGQNSKENEEVKTFQIEKEKDSVEDISREAVPEAMKKKRNMTRNLIVYKRRRMGENRGVTRQVVC